MLVDGAAVAFVGETGAGKSTLAAYLAREAGWLRLADDVLPVALGGAGGPAALPHFPQLKLPAAEQVGPGVPQRMPLRAVYALEFAPQCRDGFA